MQATGLSGTEATSDAGACAARNRLLLNTRQAAQNREQPHSKRPEVCSAVFMFSPECM